MKKNNHLKNVLHLNLAAFLISTSGALGRFIEMSPPLTIWMRSALGAIFLAIFVFSQKTEFKLKNKNDLLAIIGAGVLLGAHWVTYFYALQLSNIAIGLLSLFTYPIITSFLEPLFLKSKFRSRHLLLGAMVLLGIYFLAPELNFQNTYTQGIGMGLISALCYSLRNLLLKNQAESYSGSTLMFYQVLIISLFMWPTLFFFDGPSSIGQWSAVFILAIVTTALGHTLLIMSFKKFSITTVSIISSIQPIYGIIIGIIFLNEIPGINTIIGGTLIVTTVIIESLKSNEQNH